MCARNRTAITRCNGNRCNRRQHPAARRLAHPSSENTQVTKHWWQWKGPRLCGRAIHVEWLTTNWEQHAGNRQSWEGLAIRETHDRERMLIAVKEFRKGQIVCDYHGTLTKLNSKPPPRDNESHVLLFQFDSNWWKINATEEDGSTSVKIGYNRI